jgi:hypothetical protein
LREPGAGGGAGPFLRWLAGGISDSAGGSVSVHGEDRGERRKKVGTELTVSKLTPGTEIIHLFSLAPGKNYVVVEKNGLGSHVSVVSYDVDEREEFETSAFFGVSIDSFAAPDLNRYINLEQSSKVKERAIGGVSFAKRMLGHRENTGGFSGVRRFGSTAKPCIGFAAPGWIARRMSPRRESRGRQCAFSSTRRSRTARST